nr:immunoglobulin light chain junction region [Macaca mulatta]MOX12902.1 immunoglobulin light chain junction region [Macaca mulatta]MOY05828.1 immunoglobulin light chain junction region [Macaca mulatta]
DYYCNSYVGSNTWMF